MEDARVCPQPDAHTPGVLFVLPWVHMSMLPGAFEDNSVLHVFIAQSVFT